MDKTEQHKAVIEMLHRLYAERQITEAEYLTMLNVHVSAFKEIYLHASTEQYECKNCGHLFDTVQALNAHYRLCKGPELA